MNSQEITRTLGGRWHGRYGTACCPICQPERRRDQVALTLADGTDGRLLAHCKKSGCSFRDILAAAGIAPGDYRAPDPVTLAQREREQRAEAEKRAAQARRCWQEALPIEGTPAERYLRGRGITCDLPATLRFHGACWHGPTATRHPAMIALIEGASDFAAHRSYLAPDGRGKAPIEPCKAMLGAVAGGAVRLAQGPGPLLIGEGIESTFAAFILRGDPTATAWAALSTSGMRGLRLPCRKSSDCRNGRTPHLTVAADGDAPGRAAANELAARAHALGWQVSIADPGDGRDWADVLAGEAVAG